jgi:hypothetical protein
MDLNHRPPVCETGYDPKGPSVVQLLYIWIIPPMEICPKRQNSQFSTRLTFRISISPCAIGFPLRSKNNHLRARRSSLNRGLFFRLVWRYNIKKSLRACPKIVSPPLQGDCVLIRHARGSGHPGGSNHE